MELSITLVLKIVSFLVVALVVISSFSDLTWLMKLRIASCLLIGVVFIGVLLWPLVEPNEPYGIVTLPGFNVIFMLVISAFLAGLAGYFLAWPYGIEIGVLTVPIGLSVWAVSTGSIADLMQRTGTVAQRVAILAPFKWEPIFWLALVFIGFAGVFVGQLIKKPKSTADEEIEEEIKEETNSKSNRYSNMVTALIGSAVIALFCINIFAQDIKLYDSRLGFVIAQPTIGQIAFAVFASFAIASFVIKKFLNTSYLWPVICTAILPAFCISFYAKEESLSYIAEKYPPVFFTNSTVAILPIQIVAFGVLGSIAGYWLVVRYNYWREQENQ